MSEQQPWSERIVSNPEILGGKPIIRGTRISVEFVLELLASGATQPEILEKLERRHGRKSTSEMVDRKGDTTGACEIAQRGSVGGVMLAATRRHPHRRRHHIDRTWRRHA